jgi:5'-3' exonuclease
MSFDGKQRVLLVDGMALLFRAYYASSYSGYILKTSYGLPTNAVHGFVKYFWDAIETFRPSHVICCWDMGSSTFRNDKFESYKANRLAPPDELISQFDLVKEVTESFGVRNVGINGYEADDCIGTLAKQYGGSIIPSEVYILTGDHDMLQLIDENIKVVIMKKGVSNYAVYDSVYLLEDKGLTPEQIVDLKGLMGDTSDNYPGVKGIGEKTAMKLLQDYGSIEGILGNLPALPKGVRSKIEAELDMLHLSRDLARIRCDVDMTCLLDECVWAPESRRVYSKFEQLEFKGLMKLIG